jgi:DNA polymerase II small subunit
MKKWDSFISKLDKIGKILTLDGEEYIKQNINAIDLNWLFNKLKENPNLFINKELITKMIENKEREVRETMIVKRHILEKIKILYDPGGKITKGKGYNEYHSLFVSRYKKLKPRILNRMKIKTSDFLATLNLEKKDTYNVIGLLYSKRIQKNRIWIDIEDETGIRRVLVSRRDSETNYQLIKEIPLDSVIGLKVALTKSDLLIAKEIYLPIVESNNTTINDEVYVVLTSDIHIGSEKFLEEEFINFLDIINGHVDNIELRDIIPKVKYLAIAGDIVHGIGVFPEQEKELIITAVSEQYKEAYRLLSKLPNDIKIIIIPGNHDASRKALPQPPIDKDLAEELYRDDRFIMLGNPVNISLHNVNIYIYHGDFLQDTFTLIPGITPETLDKAMRILLQVRHAAPTFGATTKIGPEPIDKLVLPEKMDIFHTGHIHRISVGNYNNILMINSGTWQKQTKYQKANGYIPTPGIIPIVNLRNKKVLLLNLTK